MNHSIETKNKKTYSLAGKRSCKKASQVVNDMGGRWDWTLVLRVIIQTICEKLSS